MGKPNIQNLTPFKPGQSGNPNGRPKKLVNAIKSIPKDMQEEVYAVLAKALTLTSEKEAKTYLEEQSGKLGRYGFLMQIAIRQLLTERAGWFAVQDIMDRLYGKPRQQAEIQVKGKMELNISTDEETKDLIEGGLD